MKKMTYILIGFFSIIIIFLVVMSFRYSNIEMPKYTVLKSYGKNVELRQYPNMIVAKTNEKIAMTSPVVMELGDSATMYFVMPSKYKKSELPNPSNKNVTIQEEVSKVLLVVRYGGYSNDERIESHSEILRQIIQKHHLKATGPFMYMGYNAPWDIINRRNEVAVEIIP